MRLKGLGFLIFGLVLIVMSTGTLAQGGAMCDVDTLLAHQQEHAAALDGLEHALHDDLDAALENLYVTGIAYQALAVGCGFDRAEAAAAAHADEHAEDNPAAATILEAAQQVGDPENGQVLFNTFQPEVSFACATCHRVDSAERLIGPGLWGVGSAEHDPGEHDMGAMDMGAATEHEEDDHDATGGTTAMHDAEESDHMMDMGGAANSDPVAYIRESILDPSAFLVPGFPDNLMPKTYGELFTPDEINDLIAYLLTLQ
jgi:cytochrome c2